MLGQPLLSAALGFPLLVLLLQAGLFVKPTALGLAVAIPATFGYNALVRGNKSTIAKLNKFGFDLHALFVTGARSGSADDNRSTDSNGTSVSSSARLTAIRGA